jgi:hypothetical protein
MKESCLLRKCFQLVAGLLLLAGINGCTDQSNPIAMTADRVIVLEDIQLQLSPGDIPVETLLKIQLKSQSPLVLVSGELTGVSMYMGKIPLRFTQDPATGLWHADFMLGACSEPNMTWKLKLLLTDPQGQSRQLTTNFQSSWR